MKNLLFFVILVLLSVTAGSAKAQFTSQNDAAYLATIKAVSDYKIDDEEDVKNVEKLRQDERFNKKLAKMLAKLSNNRNKDAKNRRVYNILKRAGKEIYDELQ